MQIWSHAAAAAAGLKDADFVTTQALEARGLVALSLAPVPRVTRGRCADGARMKARMKAMS